MSDLSVHADYTHFATQKRYKLFERHCILPILWNLLCCSKWIVLHKEIVSVSLWEVKCLAFLRRYSSLSVCFSCVFRSSERIYSNFYNAIFIYRVYQKKGNHLRNYLCIPFKSLLFWKEYIINFLSCCLFFDIPVYEYGVLWIPVNSFWLSLIYLS